MIAGDESGPAKETASLLDSSVASANSALKRARATMQDHLPARRGEWTAGEMSAEERSLLEQFIDAHDFRRRAVPGIRAAGEALSTPSAGRCAE